MNIGTVHHTNKYVGQVNNPMEDALSCKTIYLHHLIVLPVSSNFGGERFDWSNTTTQARESCFTSCYCNVPITSSEQTKMIRICHKWHILLDTAKAAATSPASIFQHCYLMAGQTLQ